MIESWLPVLGYEGIYEVSDQGNVRSLDRVTTDSLGKTFRRKGRVLRQATSSTGYRQVGLYKEGQRTHAVHVLVARAFLGEPQPGQEVCHNDGDQTNNSASNLRWGTRADNMRDAVEHGTHGQASKTQCVNGHPFTPDNTNHAEGRRRCRVCQRAKYRRYNEKRAAS